MRKEECRSVREFPFEIGRIRMKRQTGPSLASCVSLIGECQWGVLEWCVTDMSLGFSVASEWLNDTGESEIDIHGKTNQENAYQKDTMWLVPLGFRGQSTMTSPQGSVPRSLIGTWGLPTGYSAPYAECTVEYIRNGRPVWDQGRWSSSIEGSP